MLAPAPGEVVADLTIGGGGHAAMFLSKVAPGGKVIGVDRDKEALAGVRERFTESIADGSLVLFHDSFSNAPEVLARAGVGKADVLFADVGFSSDQVGDPSRGFSFKNAGPLDMRMDRGGDLTAADIVNAWPEREIVRIIDEYGEDRHARKIAASIVRARPIEDTGRLADIVRRAAGGRGRIDPATRTFQALRIAVNDELGELGALMAAAPDLLKKGGRIGIISFHSLEDRIVKRALLHAKKDEYYAILTPKPINPVEGEISRNPRARGAKLRVAVRS